MDNGDELNIEISTIISLANGDPQSILPNLFASSPSPGQGSSTPEVLQKEPSPTPATKHAAPPDALESYRKKLKLNNYVPLSKNNRKYLGMKAHEMRFLIQGDKVIGFCQEHGLIAKEVTCHCGKLMRLNRHNSGDGFMWTCRHASNKNRIKQSIRKGTWFEKSKLKIGEILWIAYMWVYEYSYISMMHECDQSSGSLNDWCQHSLDVCQAALECKAELLGGEDKSVEFYEGTFKKDKRNSDDDDRWAFCGLEQYSSKSLLLIIDDKESQSVMEIFDKYFLPGTTVVSPVWSALKRMSYEDFKYLTEERSISFYDQVEKCQMDNYKDFKRVINRPPPGKNKWSKLEYGPNFFEKMHRKSLAYAPDAFLAFLKDVSLVYKPCDKYVMKESTDLEQS